ncbi:hypothetical protein [Herbaspirillum chlorophenolicum]|uniref:hypothetical protein n=2 Tax=Herbaspirillum chlorophenolicum TaxID=211589 RepID=UPI000A8B9E03|nr:hypothetical protein [Herbaspirillum chlorophenolicum]
MSKTNIWSYLTNVSGRSLPHASQEAGSWEKKNTHRQEIRYGRRQRILNAGTDHPIRFAFQVYLLSAILALLVLLPTQSLELTLFISKIIGSECSDNIANLLGFSVSGKWPFIPEWLSSGEWLPSIQWSFPLLKKDDFDIAAFTGVPWTVQATLIALVYPIVLSFVGVLLQRNSQFGGMMRVYIIESGVMPSGASSITLLVFLGLQYFLTPYFEADNHPILFAATILTDFFWLTINVLLTGNYLTRTVHFLRDSERDNAFRRAAVGIALTQELKAISHRRHYASTLFEFRNADDAADNAPLVRIGFPMGGLPQVARILKKKKTVHDVRGRVLIFVARQWLKRANPSPGEAKPVLVFNLSLHNSYSGKTHLCRVSDGPSLRWYEKCLVWYAFIFRSSRNSSTKLTTTEMLSEVSSEIRALMDENRSEMALAALRRLISTHNLLLNASSIRITGETSNATILGTNPGSFLSETLSMQWIRLYRDVGIQAISRIGEDLSIFTELSGADGAITYDVPMSPPQTHIDAQFIGTMLATNIGKWWAQKIDETSLHGAQSFTGVLPPLFDKIYDRALRVLIGGWGNRTIRWDKTRDPSTSDVEMWLAHSSRALFYAKHVENLASVLIASVSRRDVTASLRYADCFMKWWGTRAYSLQVPGTQPITQNQNLTIQIANQSWEEAQITLSQNGEVLPVEASCTALTIVIKRYWESMRLYLLLQFIHNAKNGPNIDEHRLKLAVGLIEGKGFFAGGKIDAKRLLSFDQALSSILSEIYSSDRGSSRIDNFAEWESSNQNNETLIPGWTYSWTGIHATIETMLAAQVLLLLIVSPDRGGGTRESAAFIKLWRNNVDRLQMIEHHLKRLHEEISSREFLLQNFSVWGRLRSLFDSHHSRKLAVTRTKAALHLLATTARDTWVEKIQSLAVSANLIQTYKDQFCRALLDAENLPIFITRIEYSSLTGIAPSEFTYPETKRYLLEEIGSGVNVDNVETLAGYMRDFVINHVLKCKLESECIAPVGPDSVYDEINPSYDDRVAFVVALEEQSRRIRDQGRRPIIIGGISPAHTYLSPWSWNDEISQLPEHLTLSTIPLNNGKFQVYCLNETPVIEFSADFDRYYVVPEDMVATLKVYGHDANSALAMSYREDAAPETLNIDFSIVASF